MKIKSHKVIIIVTTIVFIHLLSIFILCYLPFVQMNQIDTWEQIGSCKDDKILNCITLLKIYPHCWFIHKGDSYNDITFFDKDGTQYKMDIKFNWDNSITVYNDTSEFNLFVNRVEYVDGIWFLDPNDPYKPPCSSDLYFIGVNMFDKNNNYIVVYKQSIKMPYVNKRHGLKININDKIFCTGTRYFNY